jgi:hypothetical protein
MLGGMTEMSLLVHSPGFTHVAAVVR